MKTLDGFEGRCAKSKEKECVRREREREAKETDYQITKKNYGPPTLTISIGPPKQVNVWYREVFIKFSLTLHIKVHEILHISIVPTFMLACKKLDMFGNFTTIGFITWMDITPYLKLNQERVHQNVGNFIQQIKLDLYEIKVNRRTTYAYELSSILTHYIDQ